jgi:hypothetical protein
MKSEKGKTSGVVVSTAVFCVRKLCQTGEAFIHSLSLEDIAVFLCYLDCILASGFT